MFLEKYVDYVRKQTDAPITYQVAMAYFVVSSVINKNCWIAHGHKKLYPNIYLLIVGPSTLHRKSWSAGIGINLIEELCSDITIQNTSSRENFIQIMANPERVPQETALLHIDELKGFMERTKKGQHHQGFIQDLSQLYDGGRFIRERGVDKIERFDMKEPFLNLVACCSNEWLSESIQKSDVSGGFLARFIWAVDNSKINTTNSWPKPVDPTEKGSLVEELIRIRDIIGEFVPDPEAWKFWDVWYRKFRLENQGGFWDSNYERLTMLGMKLALLRAVMRMADGGFLDRIITEKDMREAVLYIEDVAASFSDIVVSSDEEEKTTHKIMEAVKQSNKGLPHSGLYSRVHGLKSSMLRRCMETLLEARCVEIEETGTAQNRSKIYHYLKDFGK